MPGIMALFGESETCKAGETIIPEGRDIYALTADTISKILFCIFYGLKYKYVPFFSLSGPGCEK